ncbi:3-hydroxyacyl-CoA dehydrogenase [Sneathiella chungangensis]|uniref:3-hydroxyacyl-CoA dehydrogenase n=1 Tax=Sneathiella chungangensis TaxID=1418234 RepID=A0A845MIP0_9PROT|nr:3-hydroxyacyl-CoA dehydrogenase [Sneathiella chungangensis]MZR23818.1 3-hydroxyacyl-CoA dehydrogenase [Sneathiella chungangensis]
MSIDPQKQDLKVGIVGAGAMGRGIAQVSATGGMTVYIYDAADGAAAAARDFIASMIERSVEKGRMDKSEGDASVGRINVAENMEGLADCDVVVEAIVENIDIKQKVFQQLEEIVRPDAIIASNTSSIRISSIASACTHRNRIAGLHFFNPVPLMKLVEVINGTDTSEDVTKALEIIGKRMGRVPVVVKDAPGFLVNLGGRAYSTEALRIVSEGVATPFQVDAIMREACGFRMGPFELLDLTGIDVNFPVSQIIYNGYFQDKRLSTYPLHESMMEAGRLGKKTRAGFYEYADDGTIIRPAVDEKITAAPARRVVLAEPSAALDSLLRDLGVTVLVNDDGESPILADPVGEDCTALSVRLGVDYKRLVAIDTHTGVFSRATVMAAPGADEEIVQSVMAMLKENSGGVTRIKDNPGFVAQRIRAMIANLGCEMAQIGVASPEDIDKGMKLGLNYPLGSVELAENMGTRNCLKILENLQAITGEDRYRPSQWLRRRALLDLPIHTPD